ncbi:MAG: DMT family transporter [Candidatus Marsarchaeota archaeon]|nr:DMT family transporter [Candidatus Marsarchaeota archaeon]
MADFSVFLSLPPLFFVLLAAGGSAAEKLILRHIIRRESDYLAVAALTELSGVLFALIAIAALGLGFGAAQPFALSAITPVEWLAVIGTVAAFTYANLLSYKAHRSVEASERTIILQTQRVWTIVLAMLILGEVMTGQQWVAAALAIGGAIVCVYRPVKKHQYGEGIWLLVLAAALYGFAMVGYKILLAGVPPLAYLLLMNVVLGAFFTLYVGRDRMARIRKAWKEYAGPVIVVGLVNVVAFVGFALAIMRMPVAEVAVIMSISIPLTALGGILLLGERDRIIQKIAGVVLSMTGVAIID